MDGYEVAAPLRRTLASRFVGRIPTHKRFPCNISGGLSVL
jgi:hypothetical protein